MSFLWDNTDFIYTCTVAVDIAFADGGRHTQTYIMPHQNDFMCAEFIVE